MTHLLFVCKANVCRSPMALAVARQLAADCGLNDQIHFDAAGTHPARRSQAPDARALAALQAGKYAPIRHRSRRVAPIDFERFDHILTMDAENLAELTKVCPAAHIHKLHLFLPFCGAPPGTEVPDPYYGAQAGFARVLELCETALQSLMRQQRNNFGTTPQNG